MKMILNKKKTGRKKIANPEGSVVYERPKEIQLYLECSNLKISQDSFYASAEDKLSSVIEMAREMNTPEDNNYIFGLAQFLADKGIKLSPVVLLSILADKKVSFGKINEKINGIVGKEITYVFNTPARIADAIALQNLKILHLNNSFKKHVLKTALENMNDKTLKKNKMRNRKIKLADLIKLLRPDPQNPERAKLFKSIIENTKESKLDDKNDFLAIKSKKADNEMDKEEKKKMLYNQVMQGRVPINQLIRNLQFLAREYDFDKQNDLQKKIIETLTNLKNSDYRFLNIFDVMTAAIHVPQFEKALFEVVKKFVKDVKNKFNFEKDGTILFDVSGSMAGEGMDNGFKYLAVLALLFENLKIRFFSDELVDYDEDHQKIIELARKGSYQNSKKELDKIFTKYSGGTSLLDSIDSLLNENKNGKDNSDFKNFIVISDEVSWEEGDLTARIKDISKKLKDKKMILINPSIYKGTVFSGNVLGIASLTSSILLDFALVTNPQEFVKYIRGYKHVNAK